MLRSLAWTAALLGLLLTGCPASEGDDDDSAPARFDPLRHEDRLGVWVEFVEDDEAEARVAFAAANGLNVNLAMKQGDHGRDRLRTWCQAAEAHDVAFRVWPLVAEEDGYWANQANVGIYTCWAEEMVAWSLEDCPRLDAVAFDMEYPIERAFELQELMDEGGSVTDLVEFFMGGIDEEAFEASREVFAASVADLQDQGIRCTTSTLAMVADDVLDGDETIAQALWTPIEGIGWDRVSFQIYRSMFDDEFAVALEDSDQEFTAGLVTSYATDIVAHYGDRASVDLGTTGSGISDHGGVEPAELQADIAAALAAGVEVGATVVYSLEGTDGHADPASYFSVPTPQAAEVDPATEEIRALFATLDALGD